MLSQKVWRLFLILLHAVPVAAHNGAFTAVYPVEDIAVDGNFSDWPAECVRHAVAIYVDGDKAPEDSLDFQGFFRLGYNSRENALYVAIEVVDESIVVTGGVPDGCEIYLAESHDPDSLPKQFALWGTSRPKLNYTLAWAQVAVKRGVKFHRYEWRLDMGLLSQEQIQLAAGMRLGMDVVIIDRDSDASYSKMAWGSESQKSEDVLWLGDILLAKAGKSVANVADFAKEDRSSAATGLLRGTMHWEGANKPVRYGRLVAEAANTAGLVASLVADDQGSFGRELPAGHYRVRSIEPAGSEEIPMQVEPGQTHEIVLTVPPPVGKTHALGSPFQQGLWFSLDRADGLENPEVRSIVQDQEGHMWFCSHFGGIYRYDGKHLTRFGAQDGLGAKGTHTMLVDRSGHLWVGHHRGLSRFDGDSFQLFTSEDGLATGEVHVLFEDLTGHLWIGADGGLSRFDGREFTTFTKDDGLTHNRVTSLAEDQSGHLWVGTFRGLNQFTGQYFMHYKGTGRLHLNHMTITALAVGNDGAVWAGTPLGLARFDGKRFTPQKDLFDYVNALYVDAAGDLWIGGDKGLIWYDGQAFRRFTAEDGLVDNSVIAISANRDGHLWLGTPRGVSRFDRNPFIHFTRDNGLPHEAVWDVVEDIQGRLWFAVHHGGLVRYDDGKITTFTEAEGLPDDHPHALCASRTGSLWIGSHHGLSRYDGEGFTTFTEADGLSADMVNALVEDREGKLWIGTNLGLSHYDGKEFTSFTVQDGLPDNRVLRLWADQSGPVWIGTNLGLSRYDGEVFTAFPKADSLSVTSLFQDAKDRLWVGSDRGLGLFDGEVFTSTTMADTMGFETVDTITEDEVGHLWFDLPQGGVARHDGQIVQRLGRKDGLPHGDVFKIYPDSKGYVWIATQNGVSRYRSRRVQPQLILSNVVVDREDLGPVETVRRPAPQDYISFHFQGSGYYSDTRHIAYLYRLLGQHEDWRETRNNFVEYRDLSRADYLFEIRAVDRDLNYSQTATVEVIIHLPYLQIALLSSLGLALLGLVLALRTMAQRRQERDQAREQLVRERRQRVEVQPHDIEQWTLDDFVEQSLGMRLLFDEMGQRQAEDDSRVLIMGETGTGKELMARAMHAGSSRSSGNFVAVRCALLPADVTQLAQRTKALSQLFGHVEGAFAGANRKQDGYVQQATGGTLFFDEIGLMPMPLQSHLLRVLTQGEVRRVGTEQAERIDLQVLSATSMDVAAQVASGAFHAEWYEYLAAQRLEVPPLRERPEDIGLLAQRFAQVLMRKIGQAEVPLDAAVVEQLQSYAYPGNVRELKTIIERALIESGGRSIGVEHLHIPS